MTGYESKKKAALDRVNYGASSNYPPQPAQEPVAYGMWDTMIGYGGRMMSVRLDKGQDGCTVPLYTAPPQRPWVGLTDEEIDVIYEQHHNQYGECESPNWGYERAIETKLKERNAQE